MVPSPLASNKVIWKVFLNPDFSSITLHTLKNKGRFRLWLFHKESISSFSKLIKIIIPWTVSYTAGGGGGGWSILAPPLKGLPFPDISSPPFHRHSPTHPPSLKDHTWLYFQHFLVSWLFTGTSYPKLGKPCVFFLLCPDPVSPPSPLSLRTPHAQGSCDSGPWIRI